MGIVMGSYGGACGLLGVSHAGCWGVEDDALYLYNVYEHAGSVRTFREGDVRTLFAWCSAMMTLTGRSAMRFAQDCAMCGAAQGVGGARVCWGARVWLLQADDSYHQGYGSDFGGGELEGVVVGVVGDDGDVVR